MSTDFLLLLWPYDVCAKLDLGDTMLTDMGGTLSQTMKRNTSGSRCVTRC